MASYNDIHRLTLTTNNDLAATVSSTRSNRTASDDNESDCDSLPVNERILADFPNHTTAHQGNNNVNSELQRIATRYKIQPDMATRLLQLRNFEIVIVCDDSGSMNTKVDKKDRTRWDELRSIVKKVLNIGVVFDSNGVDIHFLNRDSHTKVKDPKKVDEVFTPPPSGYTPLISVLKKIFESPLSQPGREKKLLVFVATDGEPTDEDGNRNVDKLEELMQEIRQISTTYVSFLVCTDDPAAVDYLDGWDQTMINVDVTDDFHTEKAKIREKQGPKFPFSRGDYVVKALIGAIDREIDLWNERKRTNP